ncbi:hypothetical protein D9757_002575 [Collybiopsis confluens]|uniref:Thioesterase domain-containing protein n=1 Tax=Collybiopsis confluens TaxID=2823264 RepID=A0A8H5HWG8_9AGAR|nr:hypothetical protein D9757_002575 [Collybiopsis confluens]
MSSDTVSDPEVVNAVFKNVNHIFSGGRPRTFANSVVSRLEFVDSTFKNNAVESQRREVSATFKIVVDEDMCNASGNVHGGCSAFLIGMQTDIKSMLNCKTDHFLDVCSSVCIMALKVSQGGNGIDVSQSLNIVYHAPAAIGETLRVVNTTMAVGRRVASARTEIWSETNRRLVASGVHIKMEPSSAKL